MLQQLKQEKKDLQREELRRSQMSTNDDDESHFRATLMKMQEEEKAHKVPLVSEPGLGLRLV